jgi:flagella basal body P-ring formation protein FlgA
MRALVLLLLLPGAVSAGELMPPAVLQARVEAFAGRPVMVDPRLMLPVCSRVETSWAVGGRSVMVHCPAPEWRVFIPVGGDAAAVPATPGPSLRDLGPVIRRGDRVTVEAGGDGFVIGMDAVAEADARDGRVAVRPANGGRRLYGIVGEDGHVRIRGLNEMVNSR